VAVLIGNEIKKLRTVGPIDAVTVIGPTLLLAPITNQAVITSIEIRCAAAVAITNEATITIEIDALPAFTAVPILTSQKLLGVTSADDRWTVVVRGGSVLVPSNAGLVRLTFDSAATGTSQTLTVDVFGYLLA
jgi:hypothetical protein